MKDSRTTIMQGYAQSLFNNKATTSTTLTAPWVNKYTAPKSTALPVIPFLVCKI